MILSTELQRIVTPVEQQINTTIAQKLTATDQLMKENLSKLVKSRVSICINKKKGEVTIPY